MFDHNPHLLDAHSRMRRAELLQQAEQHNLARGRHRTRRSLPDRILAAVGRLMVSWGHQLEGRAADPLSSMSS